MQRTDKDESLISLIMSKNILDENKMQTLGGGELTAIFNTESIWHFRKNDEYRNFIVACRNLAVDGVGLQIALRLNGFRVRRYHGPDLCKDILTQEARREHKILVIGGSPANVSLVENGLADGFFPLPIVNSVEDFGVLFEQLERFLANHEGRKLVLVSLGLPKQEIFCRWLLATISTKSSLDPNDLVLLPVGAALDFLTGQKKRSGRFWQRIGLEWLPRLIREPRMFVRVYRSFVAMLWLIFRKS